MPGCCKTIPDKDGKSRGPGGGKGLWHCLDFSSLRLYSLLTRLQAQTLPDATAPIGKIHPFGKFYVISEPMFRFQCYLIFRLLYICNKYIILLLEAPFLIGCQRISCGQMSGNLEKELPLLMICFIQIKVIAGYTFTLNSSRPVDMI